MAKPVPGLTSLLAIDVSPVEIGVHLIKRQEDIYRWVGVGRAPLSITTLGEIDKKCVLKAVNQLMAVTKCILLDENGQIITPTDKLGCGVDRVSLTWSLPAPIRVVLVGLMPAHSLAIANNLLADLPLEIIDQISSTDGRSTEDKLDCLLTTRPDVIVIIGGVDGGADQVIKTQVDLVIRSLSLIPHDLRPEVVYAGNSFLSGYVKTAIESLTVVSTAPNIQPTLTDTDLRPAREVLVDTCNRMWMRRYKLQIGTRPLTFDHMRPSSYAIEDIQTILGMCAKADHGSVALYLDGVSTIISSSLDGRIASHQYSIPCRSKELSGLIKEFGPADVSSWSPVEIKQSDLVDHLIGDTLYPGRLPVTVSDSILESATTHVVGQRTWTTLTTKKNFPHPLASKQKGVDADLIVIGGSRLYNRQHYGSALLEMLDILQPIGVTDVYLDREGVAASLGTAAHIEPLIPIHGILGKVMPKLATVIAPVFHVRGDKALFSLALINPEGKRIVHEIHSGKLHSIPLGVNETVELHLTLRSGVTLGKRYRRNNVVSITGSVMGIVIDTRGRPLTPTKDPQVQYAWMKQSIEQAQELYK